MTAPTSNQLAVARAMREVPELMDNVVECAKLTRWRAHHERPAAGRTGQWRTHLQGHAGYLDLTLIHTRAPVGIVAELKRYGRGAQSEPTPDQRIWIDLWTRIPGIYACVWTTLDWTTNRIQDLLRDPARVARLAHEQAAA